LATPGGSETPSIELYQDSVADSERLDRKELGSAGQGCAVFRGPLHERHTGQ
jgi:hypothetical protein